MADAKRQTLIRLKSREAPYEWRAHPDLRSRIVADAEANGGNLSAVVIRILSERYGVPYEAKARRATPGAGQYEIHVTLPLPLWQAIAQAAIGNGGRSLSAEMSASLHDHYGLADPLAAAAAA